MRIAVPEGTTHISFNEKQFDVIGDQALPVIIQTMVDTPQGPIAQPTTVSKVFGIIEVPDGLGSELVFRGYRNAGPAPVDKKPAKAA